MAMNLTGEEVSNVMATRKAKEKARLNKGMLSDKIMGGKDKASQPTKLPRSAFKQPGQVWRQFGVVVPDALWQTAMNADDDFFANYSDHAHLCDECVLWNTSQTRMARGIVRGVDSVTHKVRIKILEQHEFEPSTLGKSKCMQMKGRARFIIGPI